MYVYTSFKRISINVTTEEENLIAFHNIQGIPVNVPLYSNSVSLRTEDPSDPRM
jgi:hypothetical protein